VGSLPLNPSPPSLPLHIPRHRARQTRLQHARLGDVFEGLPVGFPRDVVGRLRAGEKPAHALVVDEFGEAIEERIGQSGAGDFIRLLRGQQSWGDWKVGGLGVWAWGFDRSTYVQKEFVRIALLRLVFEEDIPDRVDDEDLAVLRDGALLCAHGPAGQLGFDGRADAFGASFFRGARVFVAVAVAVGTSIAASLLLLPLHGALLLAVPLHALIVVGGGLLAGRGSAGLACTPSQTRDVGQVTVVAPGHAAGVLHIALDELALADPAHVQGAVVHAAADEDEEAEQDAPQARAEALVVVPRAAPGGEAVVQEMVVAGALGAAQDVDDEGEALEAGGGGFHEGLDFALGGLLVLRDVRGGLRAGLGLGRLGSIVGGDPVAASLVWVQGAGEFAVGFVDFVVGGGRFDADEGVEGGIGAFGGLDFVFQSEDFVVFFGPGAGQRGQAGEQQGRPKEESHGWRLGRWVSCPVQSSQRGKSSEGQQQQFGQFGGQPGQHTVAGLQQHQRGQIAPEGQNRTANAGDCRVAGGRAVRGWIN